MELVKQLAQKKSTIIKMWFEKVINTYPIDTAQFLKNQKDPFANPVGQNSLKSLQDIFDLALGGFDPKTARPLIDPIVRIRAIQDFTPSQAVGFMFDLKTIIRETVPVDTTESQNLKALHALDGRIDQLGLLAFDIYMQCREKILDLKANEMRARTYAAFSRAGLIKEPDES
jgi:antitoxin component of RelBE/YafQ-DinJ toxin-antitoxin module